MKVNIFIRAPSTIMFVLCGRVSTWSAKAPKPPLHNISMTLSYQNSNSGIKSKKVKLSTPQFHKKLKQPKISQKDK